MVDFYILFTVHSYMRSKISEGSHSPNGFPIYTHIISTIYRIKG